MKAPARKWIEATAVMNAALACAFLAFSLLMRRAGYASMGSGQTNPAVSVANAVVGGVVYQLWSLAMAFLGALMAIAAVCSFVLYRRVSRAPHLSGWSRAGIALLSVPGVLVVSAALFLIVAQLARKA